MALPRIPSPLALLYQVRTTALRERVSKIATNSWDALDVWDTATNQDYADFMAEQSSQAQSTLLDLLKSSVDHAMGIEAVLDFAQLIGDATRGGDMQEAWQIPMRSAWQALGNGEDYDSVAAQARLDVSTQAVTDLAFTQREAMSDLVESGQVAGYWRVPSPGSACDFCELIADVLYHTPDLMPVHPNCTCGVEPASEGEAAQHKLDQAAAKQQQNPADAVTDEQLDEMRRIIDRLPIHGADKMTEDATREWMAQALEGVAPERAIVRGVDYRTSLTGGSRTAVADWTPSTRGIRIRSDALRKGADTERMETNGWWSQTGKSDNMAERTLAHETGHSLMTSLRWEEREELESRASEYLWQSAKNLGAIPEDYEQIQPGFAFLLGDPALGSYAKGVLSEMVSQNLSEYGATNFDEFMAEVWAEYKLSDHPREIARVIGGMLEEMVSVPA